MLPTFAFLGHWSLELNLPGTNLYIVLIPGEATPGETTPGHTHSAADTQSHTRHCHGSASSCSDVPLANGSGFAHLAETFGYLGATGALVALALSYWRPWSAHSVGPDPQPPRLAPSLLGA